MNHSSATFNMIWNKSCVVQNKATINLCANVPMGAPQQQFLGTLLRVFPWPLNSTIHPCLWCWLF